MISFYTQEWSPLISLNLSCLVPVLYHSRINPAYSTSKDVLTVVHERNEMLSIFICLNSIFCGISRTIPEYKRKSYNNFYNHLNVNVKLLVGLVYYCTSYELDLQGTCLLLIGMTISYIKLSPVTLSVDKKAVLITGNVNHS
jgi:hypothetical protein